MSLSVLSSLEIEKNVINGLVNNPNIFSEVERFISEKEFTSQVHSVVFSCIKSNFLKSNSPIDKVILAQNIKNLGISFKDNLDIFSYIDSICFTPVTPEATISSCKELIKLRVLRDINNTCEEIQKYVNKSASEDLQKIITNVDGIYSNKINTLSIEEDEPKQLYKDIYNLVEETGNNPQEEIGMVTPFKKFNEYYGGLRGGNIYCFASRKGEGKTTFLGDMGEKTAKINNAKILFLDTEMASKEIKFRRAAAITSVPLWHLESGKWRNNQSYVDKIRGKDFANDIKEKSNVYHFHVGNKPIDEIISIIRRWCLKVVGRGNKCIVVYDYIKLTSEKLSGYWNETQALGEKVDKLKRISVEFDFPLLTAIQLNRSGENSGRNSSDVTDDSSAIAQTDRLVWFATYVGIFRRRTTDEIILDTPESGSHRLIELKARYQGQASRGHNDYVIRAFPDGKKRYVKSFINFNIDNFAVEERGDIHDSIKRQISQFKAVDRKDGKEDYILE